MATLPPPLLRRLAFILTVTFLSASTLAGRQPTLYRVYEIGALGGVRSYANDVNDQGVVVGNVQYADGHLQAFIWDVNRGIRRIDPSVQASSALSLNNSGQVVGYAKQDGLIDAVIWKTNLPRQSIAWAPFGAVATSINDKGQAVGYREDGVFVIRDQAFSWPAKDPLSAWNDLFPKDADSFATDINNRGQIVGYLDRQAFLLNPNGRLQILAGDPNRGFPAFAVAINNKGDVLVNQAFSGYLFSNARASLIAGPGSISPLALNDSDEVAGIASAGGVDSGFVWNSREGFRVLDNLLATPGWHIVNAASINRSGMIAGWGVHNGRRRAVLLVPLKSNGTGLTP